MRHEILDAVWIATYALMYSMLEIEIEGAEGGWAKNLKTVPSGIGRFTVYHVLMNLIVILTIVYPILQRSGICATVFFITAWFLLEDVGWFILNPAFTIKRYTRKDIWWHAHQPWPCGVPLHNWIGLAVMATAGALSRNWRLGVSFGVMAGILALCVAISPFYRAAYLRARRSSD